jgi:caffeoyl-CoA O-methyltransferase
MKSDLGISPAIEDYVSRFGVREHPVLKRCREETQAHHPRAGMQIGEDQGAFMALTAQLIGAKRYLEVGTFTGYSALAVTLALPPDGKSVCLDISKEFTDLARVYWKDAGVESKIDLRIGPALESMDKIIAAKDAPFDFIFIDADKPNYDGYYERALKLVRQGGLIALDNMLWSGAVVDPTDNDPSTIAIRELNAKVHADPRVDIVLLTVADGIMLARKR